MNKKIKSQDQNLRDIIELINNKKINLKNKLVFLIKNLKSTKNFKIFNSVTKIVDLNDWNYLPSKAPIINGIVSL